VVCKYLVNDRFCGAITEEGEGKHVRSKSCANKAKDSCCYLCSDRESCEISCAYLDTPEEAARLMSDFSKTIDHKIRKYKRRIERLAVLLAEGEISEQSYLLSIKTLEDKMEELKKIKENPEAFQSPKSDSLVDEELPDSDLPFERPTALWYLVPFFFGLIGGIVAYVGTKEEDKDMANNLLVFGILWTVFLLIVYWVLVASLISRF